MKINTRLSTCVAYGFTGGPEWSTLVVPMDNGGDQRNGQWIYPKCRYSAEYANIREEDRDELLAAFMVCRGRLHTFRFKDWNDFTAVAQPIAPQAGTSNPVQLFKTYEFGPESLSRRITAPLPGAVIRRNGTPVAGTLDTLTGQFTPSSPWVAGTFTWDGEFDVWVNFESDFNAFTIGNWQAHTATIGLEEFKGLN